MVHINIPIGTGGEATSTSAVIEIPHIEDSPIVYLRVLTTKSADGVYATGIKSLSMQSIS